GTVPVITKQVVGHVDNSSYPLLTVDIQLALTIPAEASRPVPVMMEFGFNFAGFSRFGRTNVSGDGARSVGPTWQQQVLSKGWGYAVIVPTSFQADNGGGLTKGIIGLC